MHWNGKAAVQMAVQRGAETRGLGNGRGRSHGAAEDAGRLTRVLRGARG